MSWNHPNIFWGFVGAILISYYAIRRWKRREFTLRQTFGNDMCARLFSERSVVLTRIKQVALFLSTLFLLTALCGPRYGRETETKKTFGRDIFVVFDVSDSMLAEDVSPNRLSVAKLDIEDLLDSAIGDRIGLITFSGSAQVEIPLTTDYEFFRSLLRKVDPSSIKLGGTAIGDAIRLALQRFGEKNEREKAIVLITDGEDHDSLPLEAARQAAERRAPIYAIVIGSKMGAKIPVFDVAGRRVGYKRFDGEEIVSKPDATTLKEIAKLSNGRFYYADSQLDLGDVYRNAIDSQKRSESSEIKSALKDRYQLFLALGLISFLVYYVTPKYRKNANNRTLRASRPELLLIAALLSTACAADVRLYAADEKTVNEIEAYNRSLELAVAGNIDDFISRQETLSSAKSNDVAERANYNLGVAALNRALELAKTLDGSAATDNDDPSAKEQESRSQEENSSDDRIKEYNEARSQRRQMNADISEATLDSARSFIKSAERNPKRQRGKMNAQAVLSNNAQRQRNQEELEKQLRNKALAHDNDHAKWLREELDSQIENVRKVGESEISPDYFRTLDAQRMNVLSIKDDLEAIVSLLMNRQKSVSSLPLPSGIAEASDSVEPYSDPLLDAEVLDAIERARKEYELEIKTAAQHLAEYNAKSALDEICQASSQLAFVEAVATDYVKLVLDLETREQQLALEIADDPGIDSPNKLDNYYWSRDALKLAVGEMLRKAGQIVERSTIEQENATETSLPSATPKASNDGDDIRFDDDAVGPTAETSRESKVLESAQIAKELGDELADSVDELLRLTHDKTTIVPNEKETVVKRQTRIAEILHKIAEPLKENNQQCAQNQPNQNNQQNPKDQSGQKDQDKSQDNKEKTPDELHSADENSQNSQNEKDAREENDARKVQEAELEEKVEPQERPSQKTEEKTERQKEADALIRLVERRQKDAEQERRAIRQALRRREKSGKDW